GAWTTSDDQFARRCYARRSGGEDGQGNWSAMPFDNPELMTVLYIAGGALLIVLVLFVVLALRQERARTELGTRLSQLAESAQAAQVMIAQRMIDQERALQEQLDRISMRVSMSVDQAANQTRDTLTSLRERLAVVDEAQRNITALSSQ